MKERRHLLWVNHPSQSKFVKHLLFTSVLSGCLIAISLYIVAWLDLRALESLGLRSLPEVRRTFLTATIQLAAGYLMVQALLISIIFWVGKRVSHRLAGPLLRIQKRLLTLKEGDLTTHFKIRKKDFLHSLIQELEDLRVHLHQRTQQRGQDLKKINSLSSKIQHPSLKDQFKKLMDEDEHEKAA